MNWPYGQSPGPDSRRVLATRLSPCVSQQTGMTTVAHTDQSIDTLISISGTLASIGLALVAILAAKTSIDHVEMAADDLFLFSSLGFLFVVVLGYLAQKNSASPRTNKIVTAAEWIFSGSLVATVIGAFLMVYTSV